MGRQTIVRSADRLPHGPSDSSAAETQRLHQRLRTIESRRIIRSLCRRLVRRRMSGSRDPVVCHAERISVEGVGRSKRVWVPGALIRNAKWWLRPPSNRPFVDEWKGHLYDFRKTSGDSATARTSIYKIRVGRRTSGCSGRRRGEKDKGMDRGGRVWLREVRE